MTNVSQRRYRRLRSSAPLRRLLSETRLGPDRFVLPLFAAEDITEPRPLASLPGHSVWPLHDVGQVAKEAAALGIPGVLLFGVPGRRDEGASRAFAADGPAQRAIAAVKEAASELVVFSDTCLCSYVSTGHCGIVVDGPGDNVDNDASIELLARVAVSQATAGADFVAPSDMMDGRVAAIRGALDSAGFGDQGILSYAAKFASAMYGPFREAAACAPAFGDRRSYQIDPGSTRQALASIERDVGEGADMVIVKPALAYLDVVRSARDRFDIPIAAYNVSGEYAMVTAAAERGWIDQRAGVLEILTSMVRAGADFIVTYHALDAARWLDDV